MSRSKPWIERAVELEHVQRQAARQAERRAARAEVVERDRDAEAPDLVQRRAGAGGVAQDDLLGDVDAQRAAGQAAVEQRLLDALGEVGAEQLARGDVDRDRDLDPVAPPGGRLGAGGVQHPVADLHDQIAFFGQREEGLGRERLAGLGAVGVPAHERLAADRPPAAERQQRLVVEQQLVAGEGVVEAVLDLQPRADLAAQVLVEQLEVVPARALRAVHRDVGLAQQVLRARPRGRA